MQTLAQLASTSAEVIEVVVSHYQQWHARAKVQLDAAAVHFPEFVAAMQERLVRRLVLMTEAHTAKDYADRGILRHTTAEQIQEVLREQMAPLRGAPARHRRE
jgi:hypothetical protein